MASNIKKDAKTAIANARRGALREFNSLTTKLRFSGLKWTYIEIFEFLHDADCTLTITEYDELLAQCDEEDSKN